MHVVSPEHETCDGKDSDRKLHDRKMAVYELLASNFEVLHALFEYLWGDEKSHQVQGRPREDKWRWPEQLYCSTLGRLWLWSKGTTSIAVFKRVYWGTEGRVSKESCLPRFTPRRHLAFCIPACISQGFAYRPPHKRQPQLDIRYTCGVCFDT